MVWDWRRVSFIPKFQTELLLEYSPLDGFCPVMVLLDKEESTFAFPTRHEWRVGRTKYHVEMQAFSCTSGRLQLSAIGFVQLISISLLVWESSSNEKAAGSLSVLWKGPSDAKLSKEMWCESRASHASAEPLQSPGRAQSSLSIHSSEGVCSSKQQQQTSPGCLPPSGTRPFIPCQSQTGRGLLPRGILAMLWTAQPGGIGHLESCQRREAPKREEWWCHCWGGCSPGRLAAKY